MADGTAGLAAAELARGEDPGGTVLGDRDGQLGGLGGVMLAVTVPRQQPCLVAQRDSGCAQESAQVPDAALGTGGGQPLAQRRRRQAGGVEGAERRPVGLGAELRPPEHSRPHGRHVRRR
jgi:hypothetical protein